MISQKLGLHILGGTALHLGRPRLVKLVDVSPQYVREVRALVGPECLIIMRWVENGLLDSAASAWFNRHIGQMQAMADPMTAFESANEIADSDAARYSVWELARMRLMHTHGLRSVLGNWSVGVPNEKVWPIYKPMLDEMWPTDFVGMHCYWVNYADISNPWHTARWTLPEVKPYLDGKQLVVTECGRDVVEMGKDAQGNVIYKGKAGWKLTCTAAEYMADLRAYSRLLDAYPNVVGATVYQVGAIDDQWKPFDVTAIWPQVVSEYAEGGTVPEPEEKIHLVSPIRTNAVVTQEFGANPVYYIPLGYPGHNGRDYRAPEGTVIRAAHAGTVYVGRPTSPYSTSYGVFCWVKGEFQQKTFWTLYGHCSRILAENLEVVPAGAIIALSGYTGRCEPPGPAGSHLHLGLETLDANPGYRDGFDKAFYWHDPAVYMLPQGG